MWLFLSLLAVFRGSSLIFAEVPLSTVLPTFSRLFSNVNLPCGLVCCTRRGWECNASTVARASSGWMEARTSQPLDSDTTVSATAPFLALPACLQHRKHTKNCPITQGHHPTWSLRAPGMMTSRKKPARPPTKKLVVNKMWIASSAIWEPEKVTWFNLWNHRKVWPSVSLPVSMRFSSSRKKVGTPRPK